MAFLYAKPVDGIINYTGGVKLGDAALLTGAVRAIVAQIDLAEKDVNSGDIIVWGELEKGMVPLHGILNASATMGGTATLTVGTTETPNRFRAAAVFTAAAPTLYMPAAQVGVPLTVKTQLRTVIAAADLPSSGILTNTFLFTLPHGG